MARTPEQIEAGRLKKAEDRLAYDLYLHLRGQTSDDWHKLVSIASWGLEFRGDAKSANHKAMGAALALVLTGAVGAQKYWIDRLTRELEDPETGFGQGEARSNKYSVWSLAAIALVWLWASERGRSDLLDLAGRYYTAWVATVSLGSVAQPARNLVGKRWSGCYASGVGVRSDPGHLEGDPRAWVLQTELYPNAPLVDRYGDNAAARRRDGESKSTEGAAELLRRKAVSELWWRDAILRARKAGLRMDPHDRLACIVGMEPRRASQVNLSGRLPGTRYAFRFWVYADGSRVSWLADSLGERCVFGERIDPGGEVTVLFPYPAGRGNHRGGTCAIEGSRLVARSAHGEDALELPAGKPAVRLVWGPEGLMEEAS